MYALTVDGCALYYANGALVTNTHAEDHAYDALRYLVAELEATPAPGTGTGTAPAPVGRDGTRRRGDTLPAATAGIASASF